MEEGIEDGFLVGVGVMCVVVSSINKTLLRYRWFMQHYQATDFAANFSLLTHPIGNAISISCRLTLVSIDGGGVEASWHCPEE